MIPSNNMIANEKCWYAIDAVLCSLYSPCFVCIDYRVILRNSHVNNYYSIIMDLGGKAAIYNLSRNGHST